VRRGRRRPRFPGTRRNRVRTSSGSASASSSAHTAGTVSDRPVTGHPNRGDAHAQVGCVEHAARLGDHLDLLLVSAPCMAHPPGTTLPWRTCAVHGRGRHRARRVVAGLRVELISETDARPRGGLVGRRGHVAQAVGALQRRQHGCSAGSSRNWDWQRCLDAARAARRSPRGRPAGLPDPSGRRSTCRPRRRRRRRPPGHGAAMSLHPLRRTRCRRRGAHHRSAHARPTSPRYVLTRRPALRALA